MTSRAPVGPMKKKGESSPREAAEMEHETTREERPHGASERAPAPHAPEREEEEGSGAEPEDEG